MKARGEKHFRARASDETVRKIRLKYHAMKLSRPELGYRVVARMFGMNRWTVRDIVTYRTRIDA